MTELTRKEEMILMAVYALKENAYLITIREQIKQYTGKYYSVGTIYAPLNRLKLNGYLDSRMVKVVEGSGTKPVRFYTISGLGYKALADLKQLHDDMYQGFVNPVV